MEANAFVITPPNKFYDFNGNLLRRLALSLTSNRSRTFNEHLSVSAGQVKSIKVDVH